VLSLPRACSDKSGLRPGLLYSDPPGLIPGLGREPLIYQPSEFDSTPEPLQFDPTYGRAVAQNQSPGRGTRPTTQNHGVRL
jgi:hypothetical protein